MTWWLKLRRRRRLEKDLTDEIAFHRAMRAGDVNAPPFGNEMRVRDTIRDLWRFHGIETLWRDSFFAVRALRRSPGFVLGAATALTAAVAVNTIVFTILYGVLLRPLPYPEPERLGRLFEATVSQPRFPLSIYHFQENVRHSTTLEGQALYTGADMQLTHGDGAEPVTAVAVTDGFLPLLGASPALGRNFRPEEMVGSARVVVLSHGFWQRRFGGDPAIVGSQVRLDRESWTVIGVAPAGFEHVGGTFRSPLQGDTVAIWRPLGLDIGDGCLRGCHFTNAIVRVRTGVTFAAAEQELDGILRDLARRFPENYEGASARLEPLSAEVVGSSRTTVFIITIAGAVVLLLATINVASLSLARTITRRREFAVRLAIGGGRTDIIRTILAENLVLATLAGIAGVALAAIVLPLLAAALPADFPRAHEVVLRWPSAVFGVAAATAASLGAGLTAAFRGDYGQPGDALHDDGRTASGSRHAVRLRGGLVAAQMALACLLCVVAISLIRSALVLSDRDHAFTPNGVLTFDLLLPPQAYDNARLVAFHAEARHRFEQIAGVQAVGITSSLPWTGWDENTTFSIPGYTRRDGEVVSARYQVASPGTFEALGIRVVEGRAFTDADDAGAPPVVVINEALARRYFPSGDAVGRTLDVSGQSRRIVGVMADVRDQPWDDDAKPTLWWSIAQRPFRFVRVAIRSEREPLTLVPDVRATLASLDPEVPMASVRTLSAIADAALAERQFTLWWSQTFAALALLLAGLGIHALLAYNVQQRHREIAIRMALGATRAHIAAGVLGSGLALAAAGASAALLLAPLAGRTLASQLYGVTALDTWTLIAAPTVILCFAAVACLAPTWTAVRTEPSAALRDQ